MSALLPPLPSRSTSTSLARIVPLPVEMSRGSTYTLLTFNTVLIRMTIDSDSQIADQISVLNDGYAGSGLTFTLAGTTRTVNSQWFNTVGPSSSLQTTMKKQLRQGGANALNVYLVG